mgnify:CR=1 FL=1
MTDTKVINVTAQDRYFNSAIKGQLGGYIDNGYTIKDMSPLKIFTDKETDCTGGHYYTRAITNYTQTFVLVKE